MGDFNRGYIKWDTLQSTGVEDQQFNSTCIRTNQSNKGIRYSAIITERTRRQLRNKLTIGQQRS